MDWTEAINTSCSIDVPGTVKLEDGNLYSPNFTFCSMRELVLLTLRDLQRLHLPNMQRTDP